MAPASSPSRRRPARAETRQRILDAAAAVFAERGIEAGSLDQVAAAAGLTKGAIYSSFSGKDDLVLALMEEHVAGRLGAATEAASSAGSFSEASFDAGGRLLEAVHADPAWHRLFLELWGRAMRDPAVHAELAERRREVRARLAAAVQRVADERGVELALPADQAATVILALSNGFAIEGGIEKESVPDDLFGRVLSLLSGAERRS